MKKSLGLWGLTAALSLCLTACGGGNARYDGDTARNNANSNGTVTNGDGTLTGNDGVTDFGGAARDNGATYDNGTARNNGAAHDNGATAYDDYRTDDRTMLEEASDAVENGVRRARDGLENAGDAIRDMNANNRTGS